MNSATNRSFLCFLLVIFISLSSQASAQLLEDRGLKLSADSAFEWPIGISSSFDGEGIEDEVDTRRSLFWHRRFYISYGALSANRIPCPPRSGRSYYTHNCFRARGPVNPYSRGCSAITRCRM